MNKIQRKKISAALMGRPHTATHNKNVSLALKGKKKTSAHRQKIAEGVKNFYRNKNNKK